MNLNENKKNNFNRTVKEYQMGAEAWAVGWTRLTELNLCSSNPLGLLEIGYGWGVNDYKWQRAIAIWTLPAFRRRLGFGMSVRITQRVRWSWKFNNNKPTMESKRIRGIIASFVIFCGSSWQQGALRGYFYTPIDHTDWHWTGRAGPNAYLL